MLLGVLGWTKAEIPEETGTDFVQGTFEEVLEHAKDKGKLVLLEERSGCGTCIAMQETVFRQQETNAVVCAKLAIRFAPKILQIRMGSRANQVYHGFAFRVQKCIGASSVIA